MSIPRYKRKIFYVYGLFDENAIIRYIGKGHANRWLAHDKGNDKNNWRKNRFIKQTLRTLGEVPKIKIRQKVSEIEAFIIEVALMKAIGIYPNGPLYNLTTNRNGPTSERMKDWHASRTPEERSATLKKTMQSRDPKELSETNRKNALSIGSEALSRRFKATLAAMSPEERSANGKKAGAVSAAASTPEQKSERGRKGIAAYMATTTPEQRKENYKKTGVGKMTSEELSIVGTKGATTANKNRTPEERSALGRKAAKALYDSLTPEERSEKARVAGLQAKKGLTFEIRSKGSFKRAAILGEEGLKAIARRGIETRNKRGTGVQKGDKWINNGKEQKRLKKGQRLYTGWKFGKLPKQPR